MQRERNDDGDDGDKAFQALKTGKANCWQNIQTEFNPFFISLSLLSVFPISHAQVHTWGMRKADTLHEAAKYRETIELYSILEKNGELDTMTRYAFCKALALAGEIDSCFIYLNQNINDPIAVQTLTDEEFFSLKEDRRWKNYMYEALKNHIPSDDVDFSVVIFQAIAYKEKKSKSTFESKKNISIIK